MKKNVLRLAYAVMAGLVGLTLYLGVIPFYVDRVAGDGKGPADPRLYAREKMIKRGAILDRNGRELARSIPGDEGYTREYPLGAAAAHVVGYHSARYGSAGLEKTMARVLLGMEGGNPMEELADRILGRSGAGYDVTLTLDAELQEFVYRSLRGRTGAAVVLDPATGEVLAMTASPSYDPADVSRYLEDPGAPMLNRAAQGAYPPGSVFKIVTAAGVLTTRPDLLNEEIECTGSMEVNGFVLRDNAVHGRVDFHTAFSRSCNVAFGTYGLALGPQEFHRRALAFGVTGGLDFPLPVYRGNLSQPGKMSEPELASGAIGQGEVLISPLQAAQLACAVANRGTIMHPYLISRYDTASGAQKVFHPRQWKQGMDPAVADALKEEMVLVVRSGTGRAASLPGVTVAGKTGSAENPHGKAHAWFVGFAPAEEPRVAVAVLLENAGAGGSHAAPLAGEIIRRALQ